jgi:hypothetical protein
LVEQYYASLDLTKPEDARKLLNVYENALSKLEEESPNQMAHLAKWLEKDGFVFVSGRIQQKSGLASVIKIKAFAIQFDAMQLAQQIQRMENAIDSDPTLAIGSAANCWAAEIIGNDGGFTPPKPSQSSPVTTSTGSSTSSPIPTST